MNTKLNNKYIVSEEFEGLFSLPTKVDNLNYEAQMYSFKILSEVQKICDKRKITRKELAQMVGTSASFITQLFIGTKLISSVMVVKFQHALDFEFEVKAKYHDENYSDFVGKQVEHHHLLGQLINGNNYSFLYTKRPDYQANTNVSNINSKESKTQSA